MIWGLIFSFLWHLVGTCYRYQTTVNTTLTLSFPWQRLDIDVLQRERTRSTGHFRLPSNHYIKPTNRYQLQY